MKITPLINNEVELFTSARRAAFELQSYLLNMQKMSLDVDLSQGRKSGDVIENVVIAYKDANNLIRGKVELLVTKSPTNSQAKAPWTRYDAIWLNGVIYKSLNGFNVASILTKLIMDRIPWEPFVNDVKSVFGTNDVSHELGRDGLFYATIWPPFKLKGFEKQDVMVHASKALQSVTLTVTENAMVKVEITDTHSDVHTSEVARVVYACKPIAEFLESAVDA
jgi:hypothetical protein